MGCALGEQSKPDARTIRETLAVCRARTPPSGRSLKSVLRDRIELLSRYILPLVTEADVIAHWRQGVRNELASAQLLRDGGQYEASLFHCHLAVEKALK